MKLNLKQQHNANLPPAEVRKPVLAAQGAISNSRVANIKRLKQRQFGDYCFDYIVQCKHNLSSSSVHACPLCKMTQLVTRDFFAREHEQRDKARLESNIARSKLRRHLIYLWSLCQPSFYPTESQHDPYFEIIWSDRLVEVLNDNQNLFNEWFKSPNSSILKGQSGSGTSGFKLHKGLDFLQMIRIIERRIRINDIGHIAATYIQARIRRFLTQTRVRYMLLKRFEYIAETKSRGEVFYDSLKQRKWQRFPLLLKHDRPATPRTIRRRVNFENHQRDKRMEKYQKIIEKLHQDQISSNDNEGHYSQSPKETVQTWWLRESNLIHVYEHLVILRDLISIYFYSLRSSGHFGSIWVIPSAPGSHSRALGLSIALQTLSSPAVTFQGPPSKPIVQAKSLATAGKSAPINSSVPATVTTPGAAPVISTSTLLRALTLLEQAGRDALCVTSPEEAVALLIRSPELRGVYESVTHITFDGDDDVWDSNLSFQPFSQQSSSAQISAGEVDSLHIDSKYHVHADDAMNVPLSLQKIDVPLSMTHSGEEDAQKKASALLPYGVQLRPMNPAFQNIPADSNSTAPITYNRASASQFFRLFYMDEDLLGICPSSTWVFYPEIHRFRDNIFNGIRKFATSSHTRQMVHQHYQRHQQYRQTLFQRRQQVVLLKRRLRRLLLLQQSYHVFTVDENEAEKVILSSPNALALAATTILQQTSQGLSAGSKSHTNNNTASSKSSVSANSKIKPGATGKKEKPPLPRLVGNHSSESTSANSSLFSPTPEMIFPPYIDANRDSYEVQVNLTSWIMSLDRSRVNYLQDTYGQLAFIRKNYSFQEKLRRSQASGTRNNATSSTNKSKQVPSLSIQTTTVLDEEDATARRLGLLLQHRWKDKSGHSPLENVKTLSSTSQDLAAQDIGASAVSRVQQESAVQPDHPSKNKSGGQNRAVKDSFVSALIAANSAVNESAPSTVDRHRSHSRNQKQPQSVLLGNEVFRMLQTISSNGNNATLAKSKPTSTNSASAVSERDGKERNNYTEEYIKRLYEYSVNVHTGIRDRLEEASSFVKFPEDDIVNAGIPVPFLPRANSQQQLQLDVDTYVQMLDAEIVKLEEEAVVALDRIEMKSIESNKGILPEDARRRKEEREARLLAAVYRSKTNLTLQQQASVQGSTQLNNDEEDEETVQYNEMFPVPTLFVVEVYVHLPSRPSQPTGAAAVANARRTSVVLSPSSLPMNIPDKIEGSNQNDAGAMNNDDGENSVGSDNNLESSSLDSDFSVNSATLVARRRTSMYGFADPSAGYTPTVTLHQVLGMYCCDDSAKTPEQLDCGFFNFDHFRAIYREKQQAQNAAKKNNSRNDDGGKIPSSVKDSQSGQSGVSLIKQAATAQAGGLRGSAVNNTHSLLVPPAHLTIDNVAWARDISASSGIILGQVLSQPTHKMECQFLYLAQSPSREYLDKNLPRKVKLWLGIAAPDKPVTSM